MGYSPWGHKEFDMTSRAHTHTRSINIPAGVLQAR